MAQEFGEVRADMLARDHVFSSLGGRTVDQALEAGRAAEGDLARGVRGVRGAGRSGE